MTRNTALAAATLAAFTAANAHAIFIVNALDATSTPSVRTLDSINGYGRPFNAYDPSFTGGVRVAAGDVTGDGLPDIITGAGANAGPQVKVFDGRTGAEVSSFFADPNPVPTTGGIYVAADKSTIITSAGSGAPIVRVFDGRTSQQTNAFFAFDQGFAGGVRVATGDVNGDGVADIVAGSGQGGGARVRVFSGADNSVVLKDFFAFSSTTPTTGGVYVAAGDVNGDGRADIITGTDSGVSNRVLIYSGLDLAILSDFQPFHPLVNGGVRVAAGDVNGDGRAEVLFAGGPYPAGASTLSVFDYAANRVVLSFDPFPGTQVGLFVAAAPIPEPAAVALALPALAFLARRRR